MNEEWAGATARRAGVAGQHCWRLDWLCKAGGCAKWGSPIRRGRSGLGAGLALRQCQTSGAMPAIVCVCRGLGCEQDSSAPNRPGGQHLQLLGKAGLNTMHAQFLTLLAAVAGYACNCRTGFSKASLANSGRLVLFGMPGMVARGSGYRPSGYPSGREGQDTLNDLGCKCAPPASNILKSLHRTVTALTVVISIAPGNMTYLLCCGF